MQYITWADNVVDVVFPDPWQFTIVSPSLSLGGQSLEHHMVWWGRRCWLNLHLVKTSLFYIYVEDMKFLRSWLVCTKKWKNWEFHQTFVVNPSLVDIWYNDTINFNSVSPVASLCIWYSLLTSPSQVPGSCFTSRCSIFTLATWLIGRFEVELDPRSELESGNIGWDVSSAGSCLMVGGEMVFVTPHFFTSGDNLSVRGREQKLDLVLVHIEVTGESERIWVGRGKRPRNEWPQPDLPPGETSRLRLLQVESDLVPWSHSAGATVDSPEQWCSNCLPSKLNAKDLANLFCKCNQKGERPLVFEQPWVLPVPWPWSQDREVTCRCGGQVLGSRAGGGLTRVCRKAS